MADRPLVALLGPTLLERDGRAVAVSGAPQRTVLARLALAVPRTVNDASLIDALWPGEAPDNASGNLQSYVSRLRRQIGAGLVVREPAGYRLDLAPEHVDVVRFADLVDRSQTRAADDPAGAAAGFADALALWRGEPFGDLADPLAFAPERARLTALRRRAVEGWLSARVAAGETGTVLPDLERAAAEDPADEAVHLLLMQVLHRAGRTPEALRVGAELRERTIDRSGLEPSAAVADLERRILAEDPSLAPPRPSEARPAATTAATSRLAPADRFIGRTLEVAAVTDAQGHHRVVTVCGPGGAGKTRLVKELIDRGVIGPALVVELASATANEVAARVAGALGLQVGARDLEGALLEAGAGQQGTLVLDNCEHVRDAVRTFVERLIAAAPGVDVLATSRRPLGLPGEKVVRLGPLEPDDQIELFCDRASLLRDDFVLEADGVGLVRSIGHQLDGLPLGLELAAGREAVFGLAQLEAQLAEVLDEADEVDGDDRRSVASAVEWSYGLLSPDARRLFDRMTVAPGGVTLAGLAHLWPGGTSSAMRLLGELVDSSLVVADLAATPPRYRALEVVRRVGARHLEAGERLDALEALRRWMQEHVNEVLDLQHTRSPEAAVLMRREVDNIAASLVAEGDRGCVARLAGITAIHIADQPQPELLDRLAELESAMTGDDESSMLFALAAGTAGWITGSERARPLLGLAHAHFTSGHPLLWVTCQSVIADAMYAGEIEVVEELAEVLLADPYAPPHGRANGVACAALMNLFLGRDEVARDWMARERDLLDQVVQSDGFVAYTYAEMSALGDPDEAAGWFRRAIDLSEARGQLFNIALASIGLAAVLVRSGSAAAPAACADAIRTTVRLGVWPQVWTALRVTAELLVDLHEPSLAGTVLSAGDHDPRATEVLGPDRARQQMLWDDIERGVGPVETAAARARGRSLPASAIADAVLEVLDRVGSTGPG